MFDIRLRNVTESTWKILKLDGKTPGIFSSKRMGTLSRSDAVIPTVKYPVVMSGTVQYFGRIRNRNRIVKTAG